MKCKICNKEMRLDDVDKLANGHKAKYWVCDECMIGCIECTKYPNVSAVTWQEEQ